MTWLVRVKWCPMELRCESVELVFERILRLNNVNSWKEDKLVIMKVMYVPLSEIGYYHEELVKKK